MSRESIYEEALLMYALLQGIFIVRLKMNKIEVDGLNARKRRFLCSVIGHLTYASLGGVVEKLGPVQKFVFMPIELAICIKMIGAPLKWSWGN